MSVEASPLFEMVAASAPASLPDRAAAAFGASVEHEVISILLRQGHKVAVPVVDDDGVDLIVDYRTTVQVKGKRDDGRRDYPRFTMVQTNVRRNMAGESRPRRSAVRSHVDVFVFFVEGAGWWIVPRDQLTPWSVTLGPEYARWRGAWHVFGRAA